MRTRFLVRGVKLESYIRGEWRMPKHCRPKRWRDNPVSIMRHLMIISGFYPAKQADKEEWDKVLGKLYLYAEKKIDGFVVTEKIFKPGRSKS